MSQSNHNHHEGRCRELAAQLNDYLDGELPPELCAELERHMGDCRDCQVVFDTLGQTIRILHNLDSTPTPLPADVEARLLERLTRRNSLL